MTQEEKELLLIDLCARLPYGVKVVAVDSNGETISRMYTLHTLDADDFISNSEEAIMPYLRPLSSMTEEEKHKLLKFGAITCLENGEVIDVSCVGFERHADVQDYLNAHYFAYRTIDGKDMFELGLALQASKDMYNIKEK